MAINIRTHLTVYTGEDTFELLGKNLPQDCNPDLCYKIFEEFNLGGMHSSSIKSDFDGIIGMGLGSSGSFSVALVAALSKLENKYLDRYKIAERAYDIEVNKLGKISGRQDHYASAFGGFNYMFFNGEIVVSPIHHKLIEFLYPYMILFYIGNPRKSEILQEKLNDLTQKKINTLLQMRDLVWQGFYRLQKKDIQGFAEILNHSWDLKKKSNTVTNEKIDKIYEKGLKSGAMAGKLLGAGNGGHILFLIDPKKRGKLVDKMGKIGITEIDFAPSMDGVNCRIL